MKKISILLFVFFCSGILQVLPCSAQVQPDSQSFIDDLLGSWLLVAIVEGEDSMSTAGSGTEQLFELSEVEFGDDPDTIYGKIILNGLVQTEGDIWVFYDSTLYHSWMLDFPDSEPPVPVSVNANSFVITNYLTVFYFERVIENCADLLPPIISGDAILCPNETSVLSVDNPEQYATFQWYKRPYLPDTAPLVAIDGATNPTYTVSDADILYYFVVEVMQDTCTLLSNEILIDQLVSLPPLCKQ